MTTGQTCSKASQSSRDGLRMSSKGLLMRAENERVPAIAKPKRETALRRGRREVPLEQVHQLAAQRPELVGTRGVEVPLVSGRIEDVLGVVHLHLGQAQGGHALAE